MLILIADAKLQHSLWKDRYDCQGKLALLVRVKVSQRVLV